jgi:RimJ/RimL family protein N-acetyltransferase
MAGMAGQADPGGELVLETARLLLRPWQVSEAAIQRELWTERDPRVPARRRIDADGRPTIEDFEEAIRAAAPPSTIGLLAAERKPDGRVIGYCGLVEGGPETEGEPELAYELLHRFWGQGYATEAATAVIDWARASGHPRLWATVWDWNTASRRVLAKLGFVETGRTEVHPDHGTNVFTMKQL